MAKKKRLGQVLIDAGLINETHLTAALESQRTWGGKLGSTLARMGFAREEDILKSLSTQLLLPAVDFNKVKISFKAIRVVPLRIAEKYNVIPVAVRETIGKKKQLVLAMSDPTNLDSLSEIEFQTGYNVKAAVATDSSISRAIDYYYRSPSAAASLADPEATPVGLVQLGEDDTMELVHSDRGISDTAPLESLGGGALLKLLIRLLIRKGVISKADLSAELRRER